MDRTSDVVLCDPYQDSGITDYNLEDEGVYQIDALQPLQTKNETNLNAYPYVFETDYDVLSWATAMITESPLGSGLLKAASQNGWRIALSDLETGGFHLDVQRKIIELDSFNMTPSILGRSAYYRNALICILAKALRDVWHEDKNGFYEKEYEPEAYLLLERARAADSDAVSVLIAWELRGAGYSEVWRSVLGGEDGDMARVLVNILDRYPTAIYNGIALAHVFRQWYVDTARVDALDHITLQQMDEIIQEDSLSFGKKTISSKDFEKLSLLPGGVSYLEELGATVAKEPFFNGLTDPVNQSHLFQIIYDSKVIYANGIPFRDENLAKRFLN